MLIYLLACAAATAAPEAPAPAAPPALYCATFALYGEPARRDGATWRIRTVTPLPAGWEPVSAYSYTEAGGSVRTIHRELVACAGASISASTPNTSTPSISGDTGIR